MNKFLNEDYLNKHWFSKNYYWSGTLFIVFICCIKFWINETQDSAFIYFPPYNWNNGLDFSRLVNGFCNSFSHLNLQHVLLNMLCFSVVGSYLERKIGTIKLLVLVISFAFLSTGIISAMTGRGSGVGYSGVNFAFYFYIIIDFAFMLINKKTIKKSSLIYGLIILAMIYLAMCFNGGTTKIGFKWYPYDLLNNMGHTGGAIAGIIVGLILNIMPLKKLI